jgi:hypothetical protein
MQLAVAASLCVELNRLKEAKNHIAVCCAKLKDTKDSKSEQRVLDLANRIDRALG